MQTTGYIKVGDEVVLVLIRSSRYGRYLKRRKSGKPGNRFRDEEIFLSETPDKLKILLDGGTIYC